MRKYSIQEIDQMRRAIRTMVACEYPYTPINPTEVEEMLRTHMMNETFPFELIEGAISRHKSRHPGVETEMLRMWIFGGEQNAA